MDPRSWPWSSPERNTEQVTPTVRSHGELRGPVKGSCYWWQAEPHMSAKAQAVHPQALDAPCSASAVNTLAWGAGPDSPASEWMGAPCVEQPSDLRGEGDKWEREGVGATLNALLSSGQQTPGLTWWGDTVSFMLYEVSSKAAEVQSWGVR